MRQRTATTVAPYAQHALALVGVRTALGLAAVERCS
jgi:hypothetical protein